MVAGDAFASAGHDRGDLESVGEARIALGPSEDGGRVSEMPAARQVAVVPILILLKVTAATRIVTIRAGAWFRPRTRRPVSGGR